MVASGSHLVAGFWSASAHFSPGLHLPAGEASESRLRITSYNVCYTKLLRSAADNLNRTLGSDEDEVQDAILEIMKKRKMRDNASYFAFTATPKNATLERFGEETP